MLFLIIYTLILLTIAYVAGCAIGYLLQRFWGEKPDSMVQKAPFIKTENYALSMQKVSNQYTLTGSVPSDQVKTVVIAKAKQMMSGALINNSVKVVDGAPAAFMSAADFSMGLLTKLDKGEVQIKGHKISLISKANNMADYESILEAIKLRTPSGYSVDASGFFSPPAAVREYKFAAERNEDAVILSGHVPSEETRVNLVKAAKSVTPNATVTDNMKFASNAPDQYEAEAKYGISLLENVIKGDLLIAGGTLSMKGKTKSAEAEKALNKALEADMPDNLDLGWTDFATLVKVKPDSDATIDMPSVDDNSADKALDQENTSEEKTTIIQPSSKLVMNIPDEKKEQAAAADEVGKRPEVLASPRGDKADDLKRVKGIGKSNERQLNAMGTFHFDQIANWSEDEVAWVGAYLAFPGRIQREKWIDQSKVLATGKQTEFSKRVDKGEVATSSTNNESSPALSVKITPLGVDGHPGSRPVTLPEARFGKADNFKRIDGIDKQNEDKLNDLGIFHFDQIASWSQDEVTWVSSYFGFPGRIDRENWVYQSKVLADGGETTFSKSAERGKVISFIDK